MLLSGSNKRRPQTNQNQSNTYSNIMESHKLNLVNTQSINNQSNIKEITLDSIKTIPNQNFSLNENSVDKQEKLSFKQSFLRLHSHVKVIPSANGGLPIITKVSKSNNQTNLTGKEIGNELLNVIEIEQNQSPLLSNKPISEPLQHKIFDANDGNIIIISLDTQLFRVHQSYMSKISLLFQERINSFISVGNENDKILIVHLPFDSTTISCVMKKLYNCYHKIIIPFIGSDNETIDQCAVNALRCLHYLKVIIDISDLKKHIVNRCIYDPSLKLEMNWLNLLNKYYVNYDALVPLIDAIFEKYSNSNSFKTITSEDITSIIDIRLKDRLILCLMNKTCSKLTSKKRKINPIELNPVEESIQSSNYQ